MVTDNKGNKDPRTVNAKNLRSFSLRENIIHSNRFSSKSTLAGGGNIQLQFNDEKTAIKVLRRYYDSIDFWQVSKQYTITRQRSKIQTTGFSKPYYPQGYQRKDGTRFDSITERKISSAIRQAINDTAINAINQQGYRFAYGKTPPQNVKERKGFKGTFTLIIWFHGKDAQTFFPSE